MADALRPAFRALVALTLVVHVALAAGVALHARLTGREARPYVVRTLLGGVLGVRSYRRAAS